jgi:hypothetical protein
MNNRVFVSCLFFMLIQGSTLYTLNVTNARAALFAGQKTLVLYDAASGAIPSDTLMDFTDFPPGAASLAYSDGAAILDTAPSGTDTFAGWVSGQAITPDFPILDRAAGFQVNFILQVESEVHTKNNRAGFSVIVLDEDAQGIELAFWENEVWAQNDDRTGGLFTHGEGAAIATTDGLTEYQVNITGDSYTLIANGKPILSGPVRDYSKFDGFPDPYEAPNFLFWGDDTTTAAARVKLRFASVTGTEPVHPALTTTSNGSLQPTATYAPLPSVTPLPSPTPTPAGTIIQICSSGGIVLSAAMGSVIVSGRIRQRYKKCS